MFHENSTLISVDLALPAVKLIQPKVFLDSRGYFQESYNQKELSSLGIHETFVQDNQSLSKQAGTLRGLHFQLPPFGQAKLIRVLSGSILDVAVDIRKDSSTYGQFVTQKLCSDKHEQLLVPEGFAHGFITLEPNTTVFYKVSSPYSKDHDRGIRFDDPQLKIPWPDITQISEKDQNLPLLSDI